MKKLILIILFCAVNVYCEVGVYQIWEDSFTVTEKQYIKQKLHDKAKNYSQPLQKFNIVRIGSTTIITVDNRIEKIQEVKDAIDAGKMKVIGYYKWTRKGFVKDADFGRIRDFYDSVRYSVVSSTP